MVCGQLLLQCQQLATQQLPSLLLMLSLLLASLHRRQCGLELGVLFAQGFVLPLLFLIAQSLFLQLLSQLHVLRALPCQLLM